MSGFRETLLTRIFYSCSRVLKWAGVVIFCIGDGYLYMIKHMNIWVSAAVGILGGLLVTMLGVGLEMAIKSRWKGKDDLN